MLNPLCQSTRNRTPADEHDQPTKLTRLTAPWVQSTHTYDLRTLAISKADSLTQTLTHTQICVA